METDNLPTLLPAGSQDGMLRYPQTATSAPLLIALGLVGDQIVVADTPLPRAAANLSELLRRLRTCGIERIGVDRGVTREELDAFIRAIADLTLRRDAGADELPAFPHINVGRIAADTATTGIARDIATLKRLYDDAARSAEDVYESARVDGRPELAVARKTVEGLAESVAQNRTALGALTAMKATTTTRSRIW